MKIFNLMLVVTLLAIASNSAATEVGTVSWEEASAYPMCDVRDNSRGALKGEGLYMGQDVLVEMRPSDPRNGERCRMNGRDVVQHKNVLKHRICWNLITRLSVIEKQQSHSTAVSINKRWQGNDIVIATTAAQGAVSDMMLAETRYGIENAKTGRLIGAVATGGAFFALGQSLLQPAQSSLSQSQVVSGGGPAISAGPANPGTPATIVTVAGGGPVSGGTPAP